MLDHKNTAVAVIDIQGKLAAKVHDHIRVLTHIRHFIRAAEAFDLPLLWSEQAPDKIGATVEPIRKLMKGRAYPIAKRSFSCWGCPEYVEHLEKINKRQIIVTGIETHVCVYQTVHDLHAHGFQVHVISDAVSSRHEFDHSLGLERMRDEGITITTTEMAICELLKTADHPRFKEVIAHLKG